MTANTTAGARPGRAETIALTVLLTATAAAYIWGLDRSGWANSFYSAAAQAGSQSWKALFFGSSDAANSITVDKPPASLWVMGLSVRVFGLSSWSILVPQAVMGVASVALLWASVRRSFGAHAGLLAGLVLAVTPVAALMFRFNNPDALLVLLMVAAVWALLRAVEDGRTRWLVLSGVFVGFGFLTKQLQVMLIVPALAATYVLAGPPKLGTRLLQLLAAAISVIVAAGWWIAIVELWPADSRPWIGGSQNNSILELTLGYNGLGRLNGNEVGSVTPGGGAAGGGMWGSTGLGRLFESNTGGQIAWLIPAALILLVAGLFACGRAHRTDNRRAALLVWGGWLVTTALVFSFMQGIFHEYYTVALAPAIGALVGGGSALLWARRDRLWARVVLGGTLAGTALVAWTLLGRSSTFVPPLRWIVLVAGAVVASALVVPVARRARLGVAVGVAAVLVALAGPTAYALNTIATPHEGSIVTAGPTVEGGRGFGGRMGGPMMERDGGTPAFGQPMDGGTFAVPGVPPQGAPTDGGPAMRDGAAGISVAELMGGAAGGGLLSASTPSAELTALLTADADNYTWVAAAVGSNSASGYQLATELPVMAIGGFNGSDPSPTLAQFTEYVEEGQIHYFIADGMGGGAMGRGEGTGTAISEWVADHFTAHTVGGVTVYDLTAPAVAA